MKLILSILIVAAIPVAFLACRSRPEVSGIPNLMCLSKKRNIWCGGQPGPDGWAYLSAKGITRDVKLNGEEESTDAGAVLNGMTIYRFPITDHQQLFGPVTSNYLHSIVAAITNNTYVHCGSDSRSTSPFNEFLNNQGGQDRTGLVRAAYRIWVDKWTKPRAHREMLKYNFHDSLHGLHEAFEDLPVAKPPQKK